MLINKKKKLATAASKAASYVFLGYICDICENKMKGLETGCRKPGLGAVFRGF